MLGYPLEQLPKTLRAWQQLIYPEDQERFWQAILQQGGHHPATWNIACAMPMVRMFGCAIAGNIGGNHYDNYRRHGQYP